MTERAARTRTLIQMGGLVQKSGLPEVLEIEPGNDLQRDPNLKESGAILLGILRHAAELLSGSESDEYRVRWRKRGGEMFTKVDDKGVKQT